MERPMSFANMLLHGKNEIFKFLDRREANILSKVSFDVKSLFFMLIHIFVSHIRHYMTRIFCHKYSSLSLCNTFI